MQIALLEQAKAEGGEEMKFAGLDYITHPDYRQEASRRPYTCGHCNRDVSGIVVSIYLTSLGRVEWVLCTNCGLGSVFNNDKLYPGSMFGPQIQGLPKEVMGAYSEARNCYSVNAFTATELICRKILMHIAFEKGAKERDLPVLSRLFSGKRVHYTTHEKMGRPH